MHLVLFVIEYACICVFVLKLAVTRLENFAYFFVCLQVGGSFNLTSSLSAGKSTTVSTVHAGDIHLAQPSVSNSYNKRDVPPWQQSQPLSALRNRKGASELPGAEREESSLGVCGRKLPSPERVRQPNREPAMSCDLQKTGGHQRSGLVAAGRFIWSFLFNGLFHVLLAFVRNKQVSNTVKMLNLYLMWFTWFSRIFLCSFETATHLQYTDLKDNTCVD